MQSLYDDNESCTKISSQFSSEIANAIEPILDKWVQKGFKIRELSHAVLHDVLFQELIRVLKKRNKP